MKKSRTLFYKKYPKAVIQLSDQDFYKQFVDKLGSVEEKDRWKELLEKAWKVRDFEIELYWKRANYFWLFQLPAFTAYFTLLGKSDKIDSIPDEIFSVCCLGIVFSTAWLCINKGSKSWQRHWEVYIDLLEDKYYGPMYQTVNSDKTFSVSKINEIVSSSFIIIWVLFALKVISIKNYFSELTFDITYFNPLVAYTIFLTIIALLSITCGYGRGYFKNREVKMYKRTYTFKNP